MVIGLVVLILVFFGAGLLFGDRNNVRIGSGQNKIADGNLQSNSSNLQVNTDIVNLDSVLGVSTIQILGTIKEVKDVDGEKLVLISKDSNNKDITMSLSLGLTDYKLSYFDGKMYRFVTSNEVAEILRKDIGKKYIFELPLGIPIIPDVCEGQCQLFDQLLKKYSQTFEKLRYSSYEDDFVTGPVIELYIQQ